MESTINERIREIIKYYGLSASMFAKTINIPQTTISNILTKNTEPGYKILSAISNHFKLISSEWLLHGEGEMLKQDTPYMEQPLEADSRNLSDSVLESTRQNEILSMMQRQMEQNEKMIEQLMKVIESNNMIIQSLHKEIESLREEDATEVMSRTQYADFTRYKASVPGMPRKFREALEGFEEV